MTLTRIQLTNFTAFASIDVRLSPGVNIFIGTNGTGKTHLLKVAYTACGSAPGSYDRDFVSSLVRTFMPYEDRLGRLVHHAAGWAEIEVSRDGQVLQARFEAELTKADPTAETSYLPWRQTESVYIPVKEMLANAPGFRSLYAKREVHFEKIYADIVDRAYLPALREPTLPTLLERLEQAIGGTVEVTGETFFLANAQGKLEFSLLAEGLRKLALLWLLIKNGTLTAGSALFWDEPESNLNPSLMRTLVGILLELRRSGVQLFIATHDYVLLKEFDLQVEPADNLRLHAFDRDAEGTLQYSTAENLLGIAHNAIAETFLSLYDREVERSLGRPIDG